MRERPNKRQTGKVNYIWVLAGGYLLYLAAQLLIGVFSGASDTPAIGIGGGLVFLAVGGALILREWRAYKFGKDHIDDPTTWSDEPGELPENGGKGGEDA